jgi:hypothetical protein
MKEVNKGLNGGQICRHLLTFYVNLFLVHSWKEHTYKLMNGRNITLYTLVYSNTVNMNVDMLKKSVLNYKIKIHNWHRGCVSVVLPISGSVALQSDCIHSGRFQAGLRC